MNKKDQFSLSITDKGLVIRGTLISQDGVSRVISLLQTMAELLPEADDRKDEAT